MKSYETDIFADLAYFIIIMSSEFIGRISLLCEKKIASKYL